MSIPVVARQYPISVFIDVVFGDIPTHATAYKLCEIPQGSVITVLSVYIVTAFADTGDMDADFGSDDDPDEYSATIVEIDEGAAQFPTNNCVLSGQKTTSADPDLLLTPTFGTTSDTPDAGALRLTLEYVTSGRSNETRG